jgi:hypothetical protein
MNMPGFTAEASLRNTRALYHAPALQNQIGGSVRPAQATRYSPSLSTTLTRPVPTWYQGLFEPYCTVRVREFLDRQTGRWVKLCERRCADGSVRPC